MPPFHRFLSNGPAGLTPGFNPNHVAGANVRFSAVAESGNFFQVGGNAGIKRGKGTLVSTAPTPVIDGVLGIATKMAAAASYVQFTGVENPFDQQVTLAAILRINTTPSAATGLLAGLGATGGAGMRFQSATTMYLDTFGAGDFPTWTAGSAAMGVGFPIFIIMSGIAGSGTGRANYSSTRLDTGRFSSFSSTGNTTVLSATTFNYRIGNNQNAGGGLAASIAAVMVSGSFMTVNQMQQWSRDPWSFWYPNQPINIILSSLANPTPAAPFNASPGDTKGDLSPGQIPWRPDETHISFYNPTYMNTGAMPPSLGGQNQDNELGWLTDKTKEGFNRSYDWPSISTQRMVMPIGKQLWDLSLRQPPPRPDETWIGFYNPTQMNTGQEPIFQTDWPVPLGARDPRQPERNWDWGSNNTQRMLKPAGAQVWDLSPRQPPPRPDETWTWNYNPTYMNTGAKPAGAQSEELSPRQVPPRPDETWTWFYNPTQMNTGQEPFFQVDWPLPTARLRLDANWTWQSFPGYGAVVFPPNQYDWPLPARFPRLDATWIEFYNPTQMQTGAKPTFSAEWPLPVPRYRIDANWSWPSPPGYFPVVTSAPFVYDWPLPIRPPLLVYGGNHPRAYAPVIVSAPFTYDWPLPIIAQQPLRGSSYRRAYPQAQKPFFQADWPLPTRPTPIDPTWDYPYDPTYIQTGGKPVFSQEWPLPIVAQQPIRGNIYGRIIAPFGQPFYPFDVSLPGRYPVPDSTWVQFYNPTQMTTGSKPFSQTDWPLPTPPFRLDATWTQRSVLTFPLPAGQQYDWPLPGRHPRLDATFIGFYNPTQMLTGNPPFFQYDWPLPRAYPRLDETYIQQSASFYTFVIPNTQKDWPLPIYPPRLDATWIWNYNPTYMASGLKPISQTDWPLPTPRFRPSFNWDFSNLSTYQLTLPFNEYDWPLPVRASQFNRSYDYLDVDILYFVITPPFNQYDWPLPVARFRPDATFIQQAATFYTFPPPFAQLNWPVPIGYPRIDQSYAQYYNPTQMGTGARPTNQYDWPLPSPDKRGGIDIYTVTGPNNPNIYTPTVKPTIKVEWLIRARRRGRR